MRNFMFNKSVAVKLNFDVLELLVKYNINKYKKNFINIQIIILFSNRSFYAFFVNLNRRSIVQSNENLVVYRNSFSH